MLAYTRRWASWQTAKYICIGLGVFALVFLLYFWRLGNIVPGLSSHEAAARVASSSFNNILHDPLNAPHKSLQFILQILGFHGAFWMRSVSVFFALLFTACLFFLIKMWLGNFAAITGTLLFACTPWVILTARNASPDVMLLSSISLLLAYLLLKHSEDYLNVLWFAFILSLAVCLDTPGMIWFLVFMFMLGFKQITKSIMKVESFAIIMGFTLLILLIVPLGYAMIQNTQVAKEWLGVPKVLPNAGTYFSSLSHTFTSLTYQMQKETNYAVGKFAVLTAAQTVLGAIGIAALFRKSIKEASIVLFLLIAGILLSALGGSLIYLTLSLPGIAVLDAAGLGFFYEKWFDVFPINPLARWFALIFITLLVIGQIAFGARYTDLAWPHNMETRKEYVLK
jgi:4-amino-4-deoxy-L-arabinose transferase-like glycosyltransferase